jgi:hypothetical protein
MSTIWLLMFRKLLGAVNDNPSATPRRCEPHRHRPLPQLHMEVGNMRGRTRVLAELHEQVNDHTYGTAGMCVPWVLFVEWAAFSDVRCGTEKRSVKAFYGRAMCGGLT